MTVLQEILGLVANSIPKAMSQDVVFVCIDCEAFEHDQDKITEIGVAVLDTRDVIGLSGDDVDEEAWLAKIKYAHYRPVEYARLRNKNFIKGCPECFNFGSSTWVRLADMGSILERIFQSPTQLLQAGNLSVDLLKEKRNVVFVGHGAGNDKSYLKHVGFDMDVDANVSRTMDTQVVAGGTKKNAVALQRLLLSLGLDAVNLHNAGNDAAYTLQALVTMVLRDFETPGCVPVDLAGHGGKLPPKKHSSRVAPEVWAGTATRPGDESEVRKVATKPAPAPGGNTGRRQRKLAARAARNVQVIKNTGDMTTAPTALSAFNRAITETRAALKGRGQGVTATSQRPFSTTTSTNKASPRG